MTLAKIPETKFDWSRVTVAEPKVFWIVDRMGYARRATQYEYNVAQAFDHFGLPYLFQLSFLGGRQIKGGIVLDFLVETRPLPTPCWVHGEYWHAGYQRTIDLMKQVTLFLLLAGEAAPAVVLWGDMVKTEDDAKLAVKKYFNV